MPRCARAVSITGYYHVYDRGNSKQIIFEDDSDRYRFLSDISDRFARHEVAVLAWCLMDNHFHLMVDEGGAAARLYPSQSRERCV